MMRISGMTAGRLGRWLLGVMTSLWLLAPEIALAARFKKAPNVGEEESTGPDTILGLIHVNTAFFIVLGIVAAFWFLFGGGRKANLGRKDH